MDTAKPGLGLRMQLMKRLALHSAAARKKPHSASLEAIHTADFSTESMRIPHQNLHVFHAEKETHEIRTYSMQKT